MLTARFGLSEVLTLPMPNGRTVKDHLLDQARTYYPHLANPQVKGGPIEVQGEGTPPAFTPDNVPEPPAPVMKDRRRRRHDRPINGIVRGQFIQAAKKLGELFQQHKLDEPYDTDDHIALLQELSVCLGDDTLEALSQLLHDATDADCRCPQ